MRDAGRGLGAEGWGGAYNRTASLVPHRSSNLVFFLICHGTRVYSFRKCAAQTSVNPKRLALCLAMSSDRIIAKQGNSLLGLSVNWYIMIQTVYTYHFQQSQLF